tara:strand:- start:175 stop:531 length:357 start_codon:yes stop_codon:yes gene_type:complete
MKKVLIIITIYFLNSCNPMIDNPKLIIENKSDVTFDSIKAYTSLKFPTTFYSLKPNKIAKGKIVFNPNEKNDGCYKLIVYRKGNEFNKTCFGYYTNGSSLNQEFKIMIENDTIKVVSK